MKALALFVVDGVLLLALALAASLYDPAAAGPAAYAGVVGALIATAAIVASIAFQIRDDRQAPDLD